LHKKIEKPNKPKIRTSEVFRFKKT